MWTRRELLLTGAALGASTAAFAAELPRPRAMRGVGALRVGLLQSAAPFIDLADLPGSRARALAAVQLLLERSVAAHPELDWLAAGSHALGHDRVTSAASAAALALTAASPEVQALQQFAVRHRIRVSIAATWQPRRGPAAMHLLLIDAQGALGAHPLREHAPAGCDDGSGLSAACARLGLPGAWLAPARDPALAPTLSAITGGDTTLFGRDGRVIAAAATQDETCVVGDVVVDAA